MAQQLLINSRLREEGSVSSSDFYITLNDLTADDADLDISIRNVSIPRSYYGINNHNNSIAFGTSASITLNNGDYTTSTFITELQSQVSGIGLGITASYNSNNRHFTFHSGITGFSITVPNTQYKYLGLSPGTHVSTGTTLFLLESDQVIDLSGTNEITIITSLQVNSTNTENGNFNRLVSIYPNCAVG